MPELLIFIINHLNPSFKICNTIPEILTK
uniref:Uncharacterized protein n=1 Tax=Amphimedon queenslandica TaxID=400682 RepID=A0A1X7V0N4_AMPQE